MSVESGPRQRRSTTGRLPRRCCSTCTHYSRTSAWCRNVKKRVRLRDLCLGWEVIRY